MEPCRCCGRRPEDILRAACTMSTITGARFIAGELRTRWRQTLGGAVDLICWFCQLDAARFETQLALRLGHPIDRLQAVFESQLSPGQVA